MSYGEGALGLVSYSVNNSHIMLGVAVRQPFSHVTAPPAALANMNASWYQRPISQSSLQLDRWVKLESATGITPTYGDEYPARSPKVRYDASRWFCPKSAGGSQEQEAPKSRRLPRAGGSQEQEAPKSRSSQEQEEASRRLPRAGGSQEQEPPKSRRLPRAGGSQEQEAPKSRSSQEQEAPKSRRLPRAGGSQEQEAPKSRRLPRAGAPKSRRLPRAGAPKSRRLPRAGGSQEQELPRAGGSQEQEAPKSPTHHRNQRQHPNLGAPATTAARRAQRPRKGRNDDSTIEL